MIGVEYSLKDWLPTGAVSIHPFSWSCSLLASLPGISVRMPWRPRGCISSGAPTVTLPDPCPHDAMPTIPRASSWLLGGPIPLAVLLCVIKRGPTQLMNIMEGNLPPASLLDSILAMLSPPVLCHTCYSVSQEKQKFPFKLKLHFWRSKPPELRSLQAFENPSI